MKIQCNRKDDVLMLHLADGKIDYAEEHRIIIVHFLKDNQPLLIEVLDAAEFLAALTKTVARAESWESVEM